MLYPISLALLEWIFGIEVPIIKENKPTLSQYSQTYVAIFLYIVMAPICQKRNLSFFIKMLSYGAVPIFAMIIFIV